MQSLETLGPEFQFLRQRAYPAIVPRVRKEALAQLVLCEQGFLLVDPVRAHSLRTIKDRNPNK